jgi:hypothetical protein
MAHAAIKRSLLQLAFAVARHSNSWLTTAGSIKQQKEDGNVNMAADPVLDYMEHTSSAVQMVLLQHLLHRVLNQPRLASPMQPIAAAALPSAAAAATASGGHAPGPVKLGHLLWEVHQEFKQLFPVGRDWTPGTIAAMRVQIVSEVTKAMLSGGSANTAEAALHSGQAAAKCCKVLELINRLLAPELRSTDGSKVMHEAHDDIRTESDMDVSDDELPIKQVSGSSSQQQQPQQQQQQAINWPQQEQRRHKKRRLGEDQPGVGQCPGISLQQLQQAMAELCHGTTIAALATLEQQILQHFQAQTFGDLQLGESSFLQLLQKQPHLLELLVGCSQTSPSDVGAAASLSSVLEVVSQAQACCSGLPETGEYNQVDRVESALPPTLS